MKNWLRKELNETKTLFAGISAVAFVVFTLSIVAMNILAGTQIVNNGLLVLDAGILVSWVAFLGMNMITKKNGPKAAVKVTVAALLCNIIVIGIFGIVAAVLPADPYSPSLVFMKEYAGNGIAWWIVGASTLAFVISSIVCGLMHAWIAKRFKDKDGMTSFFVASTGATLAAQFVDNLVFGFGFMFIASANGVWGMTLVTVAAIFGMALVGCLVELACQVVFTRRGYKIAEKWEKGDK